MVLKETDILNYKLQVFLCGSYGYWEIGFC